MAISHDNTAVERTLHWHQDRATLKFVALRYVPAVGALNLLWEIAHLPLYTVWSEGSLLYLAYVVAHCTLGDVMIGTLALLLALVVTQARAVGNWRWRQVALLLVLPAAGYTVLSEWINTIVRESWSYSDLMPVLNIDGIEIGISPLAQWLVVPPAALWLARFLPARRPWT